MTEREQQLEYEAILQVLSHEERARVVAASLGVAKCALAGKFQRPANVRDTRQ